MSLNRGSFVLAPTAWRLARLSVLFVVEVSAISRGEGDLLEPLILTAVLQANQAALASEPGLQLAYGAEDGALPDEHRRPISINAVAQSLGLPFETVRRRVRALADRGVCRVTEGGVVVPQAVVTGDLYLAVQRGRVAELRALYDAMVTAGLQPADGALLAFLDDLPRAADRALANYMLRVCDDLIQLTGGAMDGLVLAGLTALNVRQLEIGEVRGWGDFALLAKPCRATSLADTLAMPGETVRRHLIRLQEAGFAEKVRGGWIAGAPIEKQAELGRLVEANAQNMRRMWAALSELAARTGGERRKAL